MPTSPVAPPALPSPRTESSLTLLWTGLAFGLVVLVGIGVWLVLAITGAPAASAPGAAAAVTTSESPSRPSAQPTLTPRPTASPRLPGPLQPVAVSATCHAPAGIDSAGNTVTYLPRQTLDGDLATAWRCPGAALGVQLVYEFGRPVTVTALGLVPGYAKIDPFDGTDRFVENRTVTGLTWWFDDGTGVQQIVPFPQPQFDGIRLSDPSVTTRVTLEILTTGNDFAVRDFTAISDVQFEGY